MSRKPGQKKWISKYDALEKLQRYCAYQDRCHQQVRKKLLDLGIYGDELEEIIAELIEEKFLDEERFARSYVRGKFRINKWGKIRIRQELKKRQISDYCIRKGMEEIPEEDYLEQIREVILKKEATLKEEDDYKRKHKLAAYAFGRGYEAELIWSIIEKLE
jgi:regulatory protein